jgi:hypothetical protein
MWPFVLAAAVLIGSLVFALAYPRFDCEPGHTLMRDIPPPAGSHSGWTCRQSDTGYVPEDRRPLKVGVAIAGSFAAAVVAITASRSSPAPPPDPSA